MLRSTLGVIVGYAAISLFFFAVFACAYFGLGVERIFQSDSYEVSALWLVLSAAIGLGGGILGGYVCAAISKCMRACQALALIVLVLGVILCLPKMHEDPHVRAGDVPTLQVMQLAQMPVWMHVLAPALGAIGVLLGARMKRLPAA